MARPTRLAQLEELVLAQQQAIFALQTAVTQLLMAQVDPVGFPTFVVHQGGMGEVVPFPGRGDPPETAA